MEIMRPKCEEYNKKLYANYTISI